MVVDVTLNDCANNPRKVFYVRPKVDLKELGMKKWHPEYPHHADRLVDTICCLVPVIDLA